MTKASDFMITKVHSMVGTLLTCPNCGYENYDFLKDCPRCKTLLRCLEWKEIEPQELEISMTKEDYEKENE